MKPIAIIGSGFAAYQLVKNLRKQSADIPITVITADSGDEYHKPDLSHVFTRNHSADDLIRMSANQYAETYGIQLLSNTRVESINTEKKTLVVNNTQIEFSKLVLATGAKPFVPAFEGDAIDRIITFNSLSDFQSAQESLAKAHSVLVIGAGLIGVEIAMDLCSSAREVILTDLAQRVMPTLLPELISAQLHETLLRQGCRTELNTQVKSMNDSATGIEVIFANGRQCVVDEIICATGLNPETTLATAAGLTINKGIVVDRSMQTSVSDIYALGDCAEIDNQVLPYLQPILLSANVLARVLLDEPAQLSLPAMLIKVKTPLLPMQLSGSTARADANWNIQVSSEGILAKAYDQNEALIGFVATAAMMPKGLPLLRELSPLI
ncbi:NADH:flavorubredoxin reductase NorW [Endozoicomonas ascidiicola]|uniref:NADH:flavorubredoxin reductase NorW n=1 Tax=Endozoicomonas ascidiicola TaxID=1698521 RepID=UPI00082C3D2C|nr:NADH:flavorubredoxin reductase NorW [Endozoicomonas ascidiicola]